MLSEESREKIRRAFYLEKKSIHQIAKEEGCDRKTIRRMLSPDPPRSQPRDHHREAPVFGPYQQRVENLLRQNEQLPPKQRYTAHRIYEIIRQEGYQGCESTVRHAVAALRRAKEVPEMFLPLEFDPGQDAQVDWGVAWADVGGRRLKVQLFIMRLCYSHRTFAMTFPTQKQESFLLGHVQAFRRFGGVPHRISYDNLGTAVKLTFEKTGKAGRPRREVQAFVAFRSHYLFESHFCTVGEGHEKGQVESGVGYTRRNAMVPLPEASDYADLNRQLKQRCLQEDQRRVSREMMTIGEAWERERASLLPLPPSDYECCDLKVVHLTPYSQVTYETNRYSVPVNRARREVTLKAYPFTIEVWDGMQLLARHGRCYEREQDIFDPLHYLSLIELKPGSFDYAKPLKQWRKGWPPSYHQMLRVLRAKWPEGRGVQEFVRILMLHQTYTPEQMQAAIEQALQLGCAHLDGVLYCLSQLPGTAPEPTATRSNLDLSHRPDLDAIGKQPIDLSRYEQLLKQPW
ncbi:MAG: IS21 family transposase [Ktedonobacteraceae bacterium]|nr:IS21 family transposase [Ktedonobacteraceae bacterium]